MLKVLVTSLALAAVSFSAQAKRVAAEQVGLTPETGYLSAVTSDETCNPRTDVLLTERCNSSYDPTGTTCEPFLITKCDGSDIGWVEETVDGRDLYAVGKIGGFNIRHQIPDVVDMNIYTCDHDRDSDLVKDPSQTASRDVEGNEVALSYFANSGTKFRVQLFFNEFVLSGKCLGRITAN